MPCKKRIFEIEAVDLRNGKEKYGLVVACNLNDAKQRLAKNFSVNKRFLNFGIKEATYKKYPKLPKKIGVY